MMFLSSCVCFFILIFLNLNSFASIPIAVSNIVIVNPSSSVVVKFRGYDTSNPNIAVKIKSLPSSGSFYQLSQVFSTYGYQPQAGTLIRTNNTILTGSQNRAVYQRPTYDIITNSAWDIILFSIVSNGIESASGLLAFVPPTGALVGSDFLLSNENWVIVGNKASSSGNIFYEQRSRGRSLSNYIYGHDDDINIYNGVDIALWYFQAPSKFTGNLGLAYGGILSFTLSAFSGDFTMINGISAYLVLLECNDCSGPVGKGIRLGFPSVGEGFTGQTTDFRLLLTENGGWLKDSQNVLIPWTTPTKCDIIQVLSRLSSVKILGDWTPWYETIALDNVLFSNTQGQLPICALGKPDASICTC